MKLTLASIDKLVAENKQRVIKFPYTPEVVDFLRASIEGLKEEVDELKIEVLVAEDKTKFARERYFELEPQVETLQNSLRESNKIHSRKNAALAKNVADLKFALVLASVGSCTCLTKTHDHTYHDEKCRYRIIQQALAEKE